MNALKDFSTSLEKEIKKADSIAIISHVSPDGDNLGSLEALYDSLKMTGKEIT